MRWCDRTAGQWWRCFFSTPILQQLSIFGEGAGPAHPKHPLPATQHPLPAAVTFSQPAMKGSHSSVGLPRRVNPSTAWTRGRAPPHISPSPPLLSPTRTIFSSAATLGIGREQAAATGPQPGPEESVRPRQAPPPPLLCRPPLPPPPSSPTDRARQRWTRQGSRDADSRNSRLVSRFEELSVATQAYNPNLTFKWSHVRSCMLPTLKYPIFFFSNLCMLSYSTNWTSCEPRH